MYKFLQNSIIINRQTVGVIGDFEYSFKRKFEIVPAYTSLICTIQRVIPLRSLCTGFDIADNSMSPSLNID